MKVHELKTWPESFRAVRAGAKTHEVRKNDRDFRVGDVLVLWEWALCWKCSGRGLMLEGGAVIPASIDAPTLARARTELCGACNGIGGDYAGEVERVAVTHVTEGGTFGLPGDVCVMSIRKMALTCTFVVSGGECGRPAGVSVEGRCLQHAFASPKRSG